MGFSTLDISADGRRVVSAGSEEYIQLWDAASDTAVRTIRLPDRVPGGSGRRVYQVRINSDGSRVAGSFHSRVARIDLPRSELTDNSVVWDAGTGELLEIHSVELRHGEIVIERIPSRDGSTLLTSFATGLEGPTHLSVSDWLLARVERLAKGLDRDPGAG